MYLRGSILQTQINKFPRGASLQMNALKSLFDLLSRTHLQFNLKYAMLFGQNIRRLGLS